jgi:hypothetical protein
VAQFIEWVEGAVEPRGVQTTQPLRGS